MNETFTDGCQSVKTANIKHCKICKAHTVSDFVGVLDCPKKNQSTDSCGHSKYFEEKQNVLGTVQKKVGP